MSRESKYAPLTRFLEEKGLARVQLTFREIDALCSGGLSPGAYRQRTFWANTWQTPIARGWLSAGYIVEEVQLGNYIIFQKNPERASNPGTLRKSTKQHNRSLHTTHFILPESELFKLIESGEAYKECLRADPNGRYRSWEHCYHFFAYNRFSPDVQTKDMLCLHLAFYLASWGMYRGSSMLLQKDYLFHRSAVELLLSQKWTQLWHPTAELLIRPEYVQQIMELSRELNQIYYSETGNDLTDTLTTKILLGTLGCVPAYDTYFKAAGRHIERGLGTFSDQSIRMLAQMYLDHFDAFEPLRLSCNQYGVEYPVMKLLDMCFFTYGLHLKTD